MQMTSSSIPLLALSIYVAVLNLLLLLTLLTRSFPHENIRTVKII